MRGVVAVQATGIIILYLTIPEQMATGIIILLHLTIGEQMATGIIIYNYI